MSVAPYRWDSKVWQATSIQICSSSSTKCVIRNHWLEVRSANMFKTDGFRTLFSRQSGTLKTSIRKSKLRRSSSWPTLQRCWKSLRRRPWCVRLSRRWSQYWKSPLCRRMCSRISSSCLRRSSLWQPPSLEKTSGPPSSNSAKVRASLPRDYISYWKVQTSSWSTCLLPNTAPSSCHWFKRH